MSNKHRVFITDGSYPNGLAAVRALSADGFRVTVGERFSVSLPETVSFWSRHCYQRMRYPDPAFDPEATAAALAQHFQTFSYDVAVPVGLQMTRVFVEYANMLHVPVMLPPAEAFRIAADKRLTYEHAKSVGIPVPATVPVGQIDRLAPPFVFKHRHTGARIVHTRDEALALADRIRAEINEYVVQEYIPGQNGFGYFGFFEKGQEAGYFMHERLMQIPKEGGPSVVARAIRNERLHELGRKLLESLHWHGVAMVEFKRSDRDGELYLMEINPKLWGSLDLAIQSGCNFPVWIARSVINNSSPVTNNYREGLTYQWVIPNGIKCFLRYPEFRGKFLRNLVRPGVRTDLRLFDPLPAAAGLIAMAARASRP